MRSHMDNICGNIFAVTLLYLLKGEVILELFFMSQYCGQSTVLKDLFHFKVRKKAMEAILGDLLAKVLNIYNK